MRTGSSRPWVVRSCQDRGRAHSTDVSGQCLPDAGLSEARDPIESAEERISRAHGDALIKSTQALQDSSRVLHPSSPGTPSLVVTRQGLHE